MRLGPIILFERTTISTDGSPYLIRWRFVDCRWFGVYLHKILRSDQERHLHDHPASFVSIMLWGGYGEVCGTRARICGGYLKTEPALHDRRAPSIAFRRAEHAHRLVLNRPCWTLILRGPRRREWGFWTEQGWINQREYLGDR